MKYCELKNTDAEDIEELLIKVEGSFNISFAENELIHIMTFGQLCDHIVNKLQLENSGDCTSQQAFYKLRDSISLLFRIDKKTISSDLALVEILPRHGRRSKAKDLEEHLGFKLHILRPPHWESGTLLIMLFASIVGVFLEWQIGLAGLTFSILGLWVSDKLGNELEVQTVGQVAKKMTMEHYVESRRNSGTFNKSEVEKVLRDLFSQYLPIDKTRLTRDAAFR